MKMEAIRMGCRVAVVLTAGLLACAPATSQRAGDQTTGCRVAAVAGLPAGPRRWYGGCTAKGAHGSGVVRVADVAFYGILANGSPVRGAIEDAAGVRFGRFVAARFVQSDQPQDNLNSYRAAAAGARAAAMRFARANNRGSANYYQGKAKMFDNYAH